MPRAPAATAAPAHAAPESLPPSLLGRHGEPTLALLEQVRVHARLEGLLLQVQVDQRYHHTGTEPVEVVYVFPLPHGAVLLGLDVTLAGRRLAGTVVPRRNAEAQYESAMAEGDTPVMVEPLGDSRWRALLGNLKPGEVATLTLRYAQLASFEQGQVRLAFPSTIAPRYGEPAQGNPLPLYPTRSLLVEHPLQFTLEVRGALARAEIGCPTHPISLAPLDDESVEAGDGEGEGMGMGKGAANEGLRLVLGETARLDRDVVFTLRPADVDSVMTAVIDPVGGEATTGTAATCTVLASFRPVLHVPPRERLDLKVLVDCSGSMSGDSLRSAQVALRALAGELRPADRVSYSRFGSTCEHDLRRLAAATPANLNRLRALIERTQADLGGTEMREALRSVFQDIAVPGRSAVDGAPGGAAGGPSLGAPTTTPPVVDVLLITDGEVDDREAIVALARASGHRLFAVGVGSSPHEHLLRDLAEATGGACEFATPGESLQAAVRRMMARLRQPVVGSPAAPLALSAELGGLPVEPLWVTPLPRSAFAGDTVHVYAAFDAAAAAYRPGSERGSLTLRLTAPVLGTDAGASPAGPQAGQPVVIAQAQVAWPRPAAAAAAPPPQLARMAAWRRLQALDAESEAAVALALRYQLVTAATRLLCIHERAEADKVRDFAALHVEPAMLAAGWGGVGSVNGVAMSVVYDLDPGLSMDVMDPVPVARAAMVPPVAMRALPSMSDRSLSIDDASASPVEPPEPPADALSEPAEPPRWTLGHLMNQALHRLERGAALEAVASLLDDPQCPQEVAYRTGLLETLGLSRPAALALLLRAWADDTGRTLAPAVEALLDAALSDVTEAQWEVALRPIDDALAEVLPRWRRLGLEIT